MRLDWGKFLRLAMPAAIDVKTRGIRIILSKLIKILPKRSKPKSIFELCCDGMEEWPKIIPKVMPSSVPTKICLLRDVLKTLNLEAPFGQYWSESETVFYLFWTFCIEK